MNLLAQNEATITLNLPKKKQGLRNNRRGLNRVGISESLPSDWCHGSGARVRPDLVSMDFLPGTTYQQGVVEAVVSVRRMIEFGAPIC